MESDVLLVNRLLINNSRISLSVKVIGEKLRANVLYLFLSSGKDLMKQIKQMVNKSLKNFFNVHNYIFKIERSNFTDFIFAIVPKFRMRLAIGSADTIIAILKAWSPSTSRKSICSSTTSNFLTRNFLVKKNSSMINERNTRITKDKKFWFRVLHYEDTFILIRPACISVQHINHYSVG